MSTMNFRDFKWFVAGMALIPVLAIVIFFASRVRIADTKFVDGLLSFCMAIEVEMKIDWLNNPTDYIQDDVVRLNIDQVDRTGIFVMNDK